MRLKPDELLYHIRNFIRNTNRYPTIRELAVEANVHYATVLRKVAILKSEGKLVTTPRGGSGIAFPPPKRNE